MPILIHKHQRCFSKRTISFIAAFLLLFLKVSAQSSPSQEYKVKGVFLYRFAQFTDWPPIAFHDSTEAFVIGILGSDPFGDFLDELVKGETIDGRAIEIRRYPNIQSLQMAHILYIGKEWFRSTEQVLEMLDGPILTVSDIRGFAEKGGTIAFFIKDHKIRFQVNLKASEKAGLSISSKVLRLAEICCTTNN